MILNYKEFHLFVPIIVAMILNYIIFIKKWDDNRKNSLLPSAPYIGLIWIIILVSLGNAHYILYKKSIIINYE
jgi:tryptophan-rich sensory protein